MKFLLIFLLLPINVYGESWILWEVHQSTKRHHQLAVPSQVKYLDAFFKHKDCMKKVLKRSKEYKKTMKDIKNFRSQNLASGVAFNSNEVDTLNTNYQILCIPSELNPSGFRFGNDH